MLTSYFVSRECVLKAATMVTHRYLGFRSLDLIGDGLHNALHRGLEERRDILATQRIYDYARTTITGKFLTPEV